MEKEKKKCNCNEEKDNIECTCSEEECNCAENEECTCQNSDDCQEEQETNKLNDAYNKISELEDALLRSKADFINYRKRLEDEQARLFKFCNEDLIKELLPIIDNFERAIDMDDTNLNDEVSKFLSGFKMIYCNFLNILKSYEVIEIDGINKPFDANFHQAVSTDKIENTAPGMVIEILQKGYILKGKVIRPAMVKVSE